MKKWGKHNGQSFCYGNCFTSVLLKCFFFSFFSTQSIGELENRMDGIITNIETILEDVVETARFNQDDLLAVLQAVCGFASSVVSLDAISLIDNAVTVAYSVGQTKCPLASLETNADTLKKWLTFGQSYQALTDSSDLDFDTVDVESVPEVMQVTSKIYIYTMSKKILAYPLVDSYGRCD